MKKLILVLLVLAGATASIPQLRDRAAPVVRRGWQFAEPAVAVVLDPVFGWAAEREARQIARDLVHVDASWQESLPSGPEEFRRYLRERDEGTGQGGLDPWGNPYYLVVSRDSILVGSPGPDGERGTADDLRAAEPRT